MQPLSSCKYSHATCIQQNFVGVASRASRANITAIECDSMQLNATQHNAIKLVERNSMQLGLTQLNSFQPVYAIVDEPFLNGLMLNPQCTSGIFLMLFYHSHESQPYSQ
jgi:hypothetical protein